MNPNSPAPAPLAVELETMVAEVTTLPAESKPMTMFDILGIDKPKLLMALYNAALVTNANYKNMTVASATKELRGGHTPYCWYENRGDFSGWNPDEAKFRDDDHRYGNHEYERRHIVGGDGEYRGRKMNIDLSGDTLDVRGYDKYNGEGAAFRAIKHLLEERDGAVSS